MIFTGNTNRSFYPQGSEFSFSSNITIYPSTGYLDFSISGSGSSILFSFKSGFIHHEGKILDSYRYNYPKNISGYFKNNYLDVYIDNSPVVLQENKTGLFQKINLSVNSCSGEIENYIDGFSPTITIQPTGFVNETGVFSGYILKNDTSNHLKIFNVIQDETTYFSQIISYPSSFASSGDFVFSGDPNFTGVNLQYFTLDTNIGLIETGIYLSKINTYTGSFLNLFPIDSNIINNNQNFDGLATGYYLASIDGQSSYPYFRASLEYVSGSGGFNTVFNSIATGSGVFSGYIERQGYLNSSDISGQMGYRGSGLYGVCTTNGTGTSLQYATGQVILNYSVYVTGLGLYDGGSGSGFAIPVPATGLLNGSLTGIVLDGSGYYHFNQGVVGVPINVYWEGGACVSSGSYYGTATGDVNASGTYTRLLSGVPFSGMCSITGEKTFSGTWNLFTGLYQYSGYEDYQNSGWFYEFGPNSLPIYTNSGYVADVAHSNGYNSVYIKLVYNNPYPQISGDIARLVFDNGVRQETIDVTGYFVGA